MVLTTKFNRAVLPEGNYGIPIPEPDYTPYNIFALETKLLRHLPKGTTIEWISVPNAEESMMNIQPKLYDNDNKPLMLTQEAETSLQQRIDLESSNNRCLVFPNDATILDSCNGHPIPSHWIRMILPYIPLYTIEKYCSYEQDYGIMGDFSKLKLYKTLYNKLNLFINKKILQWYKEGYIVLDNNIASDRQLAFDWKLIQITNDNPDFIIPSIATPSGKIVRNKEMFLTTPSHRQNTVALQIESSALISDTVQEVGYLFSPRGSNAIPVPGSIINMSPRLPDNPEDSSISPRRIEESSGITPFGYTEVYSPALSPFQERMSDEIVLTQGIEDNADDGIIQSNLFSPLHRSLKIETENSMNSYLSDSLLNMNYTGIPLINNNETTSNSDRIALSDYGTVSIEDVGFGITNSTKKLELFKASWYDKRFTNGNISSLLLFKNINPQTPLIFNYINTGYYPKIAGLVSGIEANDFMLINAFNLDEARVIAATLDAY